MPLTLQERQFPASANDAFPTLQLFLLAVCRVAEPIALTSIFPYSWGMVQDLHIATSNDASFYAGILISAFSLAEALTGMYWGGLSDRVGRKPVLLSGCFGTMLSLLLVGFAPNFWVALFGRVLGGALNGNIGVIQTMVGELVKNPDHEPSAYAVMPFVWSIGTILGPAIGGLLVKPAESYPSLFAPTGLFGKFPYLLPNLVCSVLLLISIIFGWLFLYETHPDMQPCNDHISKDYDSLTPLLAAGSDIDNRCYETLRQPDSVIQAHLQEESGWTVLERCESVSPFTWKVSMLVVALAIFAYHSMTYDHLFPIFLQDANVRNTPDASGIDFSIPGGLGLSTHTVGLIMSSDGIIALFIQGIIFPALASRLGAWKLFVIVTILHPVAYFIVPFLVFAPENLLLVGIYTCLVIRNILSIIDYPVLMILLRQASPSDAVMGKVNGLAASASAATRTIAPPIAGLLYSTGAKFGFTALAWWASAVVAMLGAMQLWFMTQHKSTLVMEQSGTSLEYSPQTKPIQVVITDVESNSTRSSYCSL